jgi:predicted dehydrogenase
MSEEPVPVAVVGAGNMGSNHIRVYDQLPGADLVEVVEPDAERAATVRDEYDVRIVDSVAELRSARAATVAVPNVLHREVARECAERGLDILVEKPLAMTLADARSIVEVAEANDVVLQTGHIERFNPAIRTLSTILDDEDVIAIEAHRLGPFNEHLTEESVVFDLMIHDLDIIDTLVAGEIGYADAVGSASRSRELDHAIATFKFEDGTLATATSSHVTHGKVRQLQVTTRNAYISLDYQEQGITIQRRGTERTMNLFEKGGYRTETVAETPFVRTREPLKNELEHFLSCVRDRSVPEVDGADGLRAVELASEVIDRIGTH